MKVICINGVWKINGTPDRSNDNPKLGEVVTALDRFINQNEEVYLLKEYLYAGGYVTKCFIPLSEIDETEFERNYNKQLA